MSLQLVTRADWAAAAPKRRPRNIVPSKRKGVVLHWNGPPLRLNTNADAAALRRRERAVVKAIQRFHQRNQGWSDAAYSYLVGQSGTIYEVRGDNWDQFANGSDNVGVNDGSDKDFYTVMVMIGEGERPTAAAKNAVTAIVGHVRGLGTGDRVLPHNAFKRKTCPGKDLIELARTLDRTVIDLTNKITTERVVEPDVRLGAWPRTFLDAATARVYSPGVEIWQRCLLAAGFSPGKIDGLVGTKTMNANNAFARSIDQPESDRPSDVVWTALLDKMTHPVTTPAKTT